MNKKAQNHLHNALRDLTLAEEYASDPFGAADAIKEIRSATTSIHEALKEKDNDDL